MFGAAAASASIPALVSSIATQYGLPPTLALAVAQEESGFNPNAVSSAGAIGVMQLMPATAASLGVSNPLDPTQNITGGVKYLSSLLSQFGDPAQALAAYNWGPGNVANAISEYGSSWLSYAPSETQNYVASIMAAAGIAMQSVPAPVATDDTSDPTDFIDNAENTVSDFISSVDPTTVYLLTGAVIGVIVLRRALS